MSVICSARGQNLNSFAHFIRAIALESLYNGESVAKRQPYARRIRVYTKRKAVTPMAEEYPANYLSSILGELRDTDKNKRRTAVMKLGMLGNDEAVNHLIRLVDNHREDTIVRGKAAQLLGTLGDTRAVLPLIRALDAPGYQTPLHAVESLGKLGDVRAVPFLESVAATKKDRLREAAVEALRRLHSLSENHRTEAELPVPQA